MRAIHDTVSTNLSRMLVKWTKCPETFSWKYPKEFGFISCVPRNTVPIILDLHVLDLNRKENNKTCCFFSVPDIQNNTFSDPSSM